MHTRYPILLVHGLGVRDLPLMPCFGRIDRILRIQGYSVHISRIDAFGSVESNASQLRSEVLHIAKESGCGKVNIVAHSKGGLDASRMLQLPDVQEHVASLTTLCTPHRGSPIASLVLRLPTMLLKLIAACIDLFYRLMGDARPDSLSACRDLQRAEGRSITAPDTVYCQSYSASLPIGRWYRDLFMFWPLMVSHWLEPGCETDGMVPSSSAMFGRYRGACIPGPLSHIGIIDRLQLGRRRDRVYAFWSQLCEELSLSGY